MIDAPRGAADHSRRPRQVQNQTLSLRLSPQPTNPTKSLAFAAYATCRRRALGEPHDSRLLSARSLAISARAPRGSVLMRYCSSLLVYAMPHFDQGHPFEGLPALDVHAASPKALCLLPIACRATETSLISFEIVAGPSRLNKPIGWPRKAASTSSAPCSPLALHSVLRVRGRHPRPGVPFGGAQQAGRRRRVARSGIMPSGVNGTQSRREFSSYTPPRAATDSRGGSDNHWLGGSVACKKCTITAEHAAGNRCTNRLPTESRFVMQPRRVYSTAVP